MNISHNNWNKDYGMIHLLHESDKSMVVSIDVINSLEMASDVIISNIIFGIHSIHVISISISRH